jgi:hypothetical protein
VVAVLTIRRADARVRILVPCHLHDTGKGTE